MNSLMMAPNHYAALLKSCVLLKRQESSRFGIWGVHRGTDRVDSYHLKLSGVILLLTTEGWLHPDHTKANAISCWTSYQVGQHREIFYSILCQMQWAVLLLLLLLVCQAMLSIPMTHNYYMQKNIIWAVIRHVIYLFHILKKNLHFSSPPYPSIPRVPLY